MHYLDDFLLIGAPRSGEALTALEMATRTFQSIGIPVASDKTEGPSTCITHLGIVIDTMSLQLCLPELKLQRSTAASSGVVGQAFLYLEGARASAGPPVPCCHNYPPWSDIPPSTLQPVVTGAQAIPSCLFEPPDTCRLEVLATFSTGLEWHSFLPSDGGVGAHLL